MLHRAVLALASERLRQSPSGQGWLLRALALEESRERVPPRWSPDPAHLRHRRVPHELRRRQSWRQILVPCRSSVLLKRTSSSCRGERGVVQQSQRAAAEKTSVTCARQRRATVGAAALQSSSASKPSQWYDVTEGDGVQSFSLRERVWFWFGEVPKRDPTRDPSLPSPNPLQKHTRTPRLPGWREHESHTSSRPSARLETRKAAARGTHTVREEKERSAEVLPKKPNQRILWDKSGGGVGRTSHTSLGF